MMKSMSVVMHFAHLSVLPPVTAGSVSFVVCGCASGPQLQQHTLPQNKINPCSSTHSFPLIFFLVLPFISQPIKCFAVCARETDRNGQYIYYCKLAVT